MRGHVGFRRQAAVGDGDAQRLLQRRFDAVVDVVDAFLQAVVFRDQGVAGQHPRHPLVAFREGQQHGYRLMGLGQAVGLGGGDLVHQREDAGFDEFDQPFEHLRLAGEMPV
ncbi:hypothetical protein D9M70_610870 [compost metagenome]